LGGGDWPVFLQPPSRLITDHLMPGMTGGELAHAVRARRPETKILIVWGYAEGDGLDQSLPCLTKPFLQSDLASAVAGLGSKCDVRKP